MSSLTSALIIQIVICVILFAILFYLMAKNSKLKIEIESKTNNSPNIQNGD